MLWLLDTNVMSEAVRPRPAVAEVERLKPRRKALAVPTPVWHELLYGWLRMPDSVRKDAIERYLRSVVAPFTDAVL